MKFRGTVLFLTGFIGTLGLGWVGFPRALYRATPQPLTFSHKTHTGDKGGMKCEDCHALGEDGRFSGVPQLDKCSGCHTAPMGNSASEKLLVERYVTPNRQIPWAVYARQPENVYFPHAAHVKLARLTCQECHGQHGATTSLRAYQENRISGYSRDIWGPSIARVPVSKRRPGMKMDDCADCHARHGLEHSCLDCHK